MSVFFLSVNFCRADAHFPSTTVPGENLLFWFDAGHGVQTNGDGRVIHWENRLSNQKDLVKDDSKDGPEWKENVANGNPMLYFNRERQTCLRYPTPGAGDLCNGMTLFIVHKTMSADNMQTYIGTSGKWLRSYPGASVHLFTKDGNFTYAMYGRKYVTPSLKTAGGDAPLKIGSVQIHEILDNSGPYKLFTDGALTADFGGIKEDNKNFRGFCVGTWDGAWNDANKRFFEGYIGEILIYGRALSEEERGKVGRYLSEKWGIASSRYGFPEKRFEEDINIGEGERRTFASYGGWVSALTGGSGAGLVLDAPLTLETAGENVYAGSSGGPGGLTVRGSGSLIFSGTHAYKGSTVVDGGTLKVIGSLYAEGNSPVSTVTVRNGGVLEAGDGALGSFTTDSSSSFRIDGGILRLSGSGDLSSGKVAVSVGREGVTVEAIAGASLRLGTEDETWTFDPFAQLTLSGEGNGVYSNGFMSLGPIVKTGSGEWTLAGKASGYNGYAPVRVKSGILKIAVEKDAASAVSAGDIDRPSLWFDASDPGSLTVENGHVTKWTSRGTMEGVFATGPVGPSVTRDIGALGTLRFSKDAQEYLRVENSPLHPADVSIFVVYKIYSPEGSILSSDLWTRSGNDGVSMHLIIHGNTRSPQLSVWDAGDRLPTLTSELGATHLATCVDAYGDNSRNDCVFYLGCNGIEDAQYQVYKKVKNLRKFTIGAWKSRSGLERFLNGSIGEILVYETALAPAEREKVEQYLKNKWFARIPRVEIDREGVLDLGAGSCSVTELTGGGTVAHGALQVLEDLCPAGAGTAGSMTLDDVDLTLKGTLHADIDEEGNFDSLTVNGALDLTEGYLSIDNPGRLDPNKHYVLIRGEGELKGPFAGISGIPGSFKAFYNSASGRVVVAPTGLELLLK